MNPEDKILLLVCRNYARKFFNPKKKNIEFNELVNVAYIMARQYSGEFTLEGSIIWALLRFTTRPQRSFRGEALADLRIKDYRLSTRDYEALNPEKIIQLEEDHDLLIIAVRKLSEAQRNLIYWKYRDNMTFKQIGEALSCSDRWASKMLNDVLRELRTSLK